MDHPTRRALQRLLLDLLAYGSIGDTRVDWVMGTDPEAKGRGAFVRALLGTYAYPHDTVIGRSWHLHHHLDNAMAANEPLRWTARHLLANTDGPTYTVGELLDFMGLVDAPHTPHGVLQDLLRLRLAHTDVARLADPVPFYPL